ncbi:MAG: sortase [Ruminococcus sp.]|nr:sortase [Ruminococcus sp.]
MKNKIRKIFIITGTMLILSALFLCVYNLRQSNKAFEQSQEVLTELKELIPEPVTEAADEEVPTDAPYSEDFVNPADDLFAPYEEQEEEEEAPQPPAPVELDGSYYCGYITLPALGLELPVVDGWSYEALRYSPCRYSGNAEEKNMIVAAHNYNNHFGRIGSLNTGDEVIFTDTAGVQHFYEVDYTQYVDGYDVDGMFSGQDEEWDLTIFTCTLSGQSRVTVRCVAR